MTHWPGRPAWRRRLLRSRSRPKPPCTRGASRRCRDQKKAREERELKVNDAQQTAEERKRAAAQDAQAHTEAVKKQADKRKQADRIEELADVEKKKRQMNWLSDRDRDEPARRYRNCLDHRSLGCAIGRGDRQDGADGQFVTVVGVTGEPVGEPLRGQLSDRGRVLWLREAGDQICAELDQRVTASHRIHVHAP